MTRRFGSLLPNTESRKDFNTEVTEVTKVMTEYVRRRTLLSPLNELRNRAVSIQRSERHFERRGRRGLAFGIALALTSVSADGQAVRVVVLDSSSAAPLSDALISLLDTTAGLIGLHRTSDRGMTWLKVPSAGHYAVYVQKQGYRQLVSNWLTFGNTDTLEVTFRLTAVAQNLGRVIVTAEMDSVGPLLPPGINAKTLAGRVIKPSEIAAHSMGAPSYISILESVGRRDFIVTRFGSKACLTSTRVLRRPTMHQPLCTRVFVNNMRADFEMALDLVSPENLDFAVWLRASDAGVLFGSALPGEDESVLLLYTKDWRRTHTTRRDDR